MMIYQLDKILKKIQQTVKSVGQLVNDRADLDDVIDLFKTIVATAKKVEALEKRLKELEDKFDNLKFPTKTRYRN